MEVQRGEFLKILESLKLGVGSGSGDIGLETIAFTKSRLVSFNKVISVSFPFASNFSCLVSYEKLSSVIKELKSEKVDFNFKDSQLRIESSNGKSGITQIEDSHVWETIKEIDPSGIKKWVKIPKTFLSGLSLCLFSIMREIILTPLACIFIDGQDLYSSDNLRISHFTMDEKMGRFLIPGDAVSDLVKFPVVDFSVDKSWIYFRTKEKSVFSFRLLEGEFPNCRDFFSVKGIKIEFPEGLIELLPSLAIFRGDGESDMDTKASFSFKSGDLVCRSEAPSGWIERRIRKVKYQGKDFSFFINPLFLKQILESSSTMVISEDRTRALFTSKNFQHLIALPVVD